LFHECFGSARRLSKVRTDFVPTFDGTVASKLRRAPRGGDRSRETGRIGRVDGCLRDCGRRNSQAQGERRVAIPNVRGWFVFRTGTKSILRLHLIPELGSRTLDTISNEQVQRLKLRLHDKSPKTINNMLSVLQRAVEAGGRVLCAGQDVLFRIRLVRVPRTDAAFHGSMTTGAC
jgi:hypothetical protein